MTYKKTYAAILTKNTVTKESAGKCKVIYSKDCF